MRVDGGGGAGREGSAARVGESDPDDVASVGGHRYHTFMSHVITVR